MNDLDEAVRDHAQYMGNCCGRASEAAEELAVLNKALGQALACNDDLAKMNAQLRADIVGVNAAYLGVCERNEELRVRLFAAQKRLESATKLIKLADEVIGCTAMQDFAVWLREEKK